MAKTIKNVKNSLKYKANVRDNVLTLKIGQKRYVVPVEARILASGDFVFLSFNASSELYKIENDGLSALPGDADGSAALEALEPKRRRRKGGPSRVEMPVELQEVLSKLPAGTKLVASPTGSYRLVKTRARRKKGE